MQARLGLMILPAMRSIVRRRRGACHWAALRADPVAPPHHEGERTGCRQHPADPHAPTPPPPA